MEVKSAVERLLKLSPSVRVVTVCNLNGKLLYTAHAKRVKNVLSPKESRDSLKNAAKAWKGRRALSRKLGRCKYVVAEYDSIKRITLPAGKNHIIFVSTTAAFDHRKVISKARSFR